MPRPRTLLAPLLLGAMVNIAIAWSLSTPGPETWTVTGQTTAAGMPLVFHLAQGRARQRCLCMVTATPDATLNAGFGGGAVRPATFSSTAHLPRWCFPAEGLPPLKPDLDGTTYSSIASGWPMLSMVHHILPGTGKPLTVLDQVRRGLPSPSRQPFYVQPRLPLIPVWPGFLVNTLLYAIPFVLFFNGVGRLRAAIRRRAGRCVRCHYDIRGIASPCPECGTPFA